MMTRISVHNKCVLTTVTLVLLLSAATAVAQQTTSFTYQGRLTDSGTAANGTYDFQFTLWDLLSGGTQQPQPTPVTVTQTSVAVSSGVFTVQLDFGASAFPGANRFLEIGARLSGGGAFTILSPRQPITSTPYAIRSANASSADAVTVSGVPGGSGNYIQNATTPQASANFNISGNGTAGGTLSSNIVNAATQYRIAGLTALAAPGNSNLVAGFNSGAAITAGNNNAFFGLFSGALNNTGYHNSFFGYSSGDSNTVGGNNSFFGQAAGSSNTTGTDNTLIGVYSDVGANPLRNATAIGARSRVDQSDSIVLGSIAGVNGETITVKVGIGTTAPLSRLDIAATGDGAELLRFSTERPWVFRQVRTGPSAGLQLLSTTGQKKFEITAVAGENVATFLADSTSSRVGIGTTAPDQTLSVNGNASKEGGGSWLAFSDERLKNIKGRFTPGLAAVMRLQPLRYQYKPDNAMGLRAEGEYVGFGAQAVQRVIPEAVTRNDKGYLLVNNDPILWTMLNAIKEQQSQIETLRTANTALNARLRSVERIVKKRVGLSRRRH
jgi:hypothetical protein